MCKASPPSAHEANRAALARHHTYALFSQLYLRGLTAPLLTHVQAIPQLAKTVSPAFAPDAAAADHYHLFGFNLFPYASAFIGEHGLLGGSVTESVSGAYADAGFRVDLASTAADHVGCEMAFMAFLNMQEAKAFDLADATAARRARRRQASFLQNHLLSWLPPFVVALQRQEDRFFAALGELTARFMSAHFGELPDEHHSEQICCVVSRAAEASHDHDYRDLKGLSDYLTGPGLCGLYLSRDKISVLARVLQLPRGFGSRKQMLLALLEAAQHYGRLSELLEALKVEVIAWQESYERYLADFPSLKVYVVNWRNRTTATRKLLEDGALDS